MHIQEKIAQAAQRRGFSGKQNFEELKKQYSSSNLFEDPEFPADNESLDMDEDLDPRTIVWKRPKVFTLIFQIRIDCMQDQWLRIR